MLPLQRIDRYIEHLKDIENFTTEENKDKIFLNKAIELMNTTISSLKNGTIFFVKYYSFKLFFNIEIKDAEERNKLESLNKRIVGLKYNLIEKKNGLNRQILHQGVLDKFDNKKG